MRKLALPVLVISLLVLAASAIYGADPGLGHPQTAAFKPEQFTDADTCGMCHPQMLEQWNGTMHANSAVDPYYHRAVLLAKADVPGVEAFCSSCHAPVAMLTGQDPLALDALTPAAKNGVGCDICHTVKELAHTGNFGYIAQPGEVKFGPFGTVPQMFHTVEKSELLGQAKFCGSCHDVAHPLNKLQLESTYSEYLAGPYPAEGVACQYCHMTHGYTKYEAFPGSIVSGGQQLDHIWTHDIVGGNTFVTSMLGADERAKSATERLSRAAAVELTGVKADADTLQFDAKVTNIGAGHKLPTGVTEERQIWLDVRVLAADGTELAHFGQLDEHGSIPEDTLILETKFGDAQGKVTHRIWLATSVISDRRIAPRQSEAQHYSVTVPAGAKPAAIEAQLLYRSSHQDFIDELFSDTPEHELVPNVLMVKTEAKL
jgi:hypothetical protein